MNKALIVSSDEAAASAIEHNLRCNGYVNIRTSAYANQARRIIKNEIKPDLIIVNTPLSDEFGIEFSVMAAESTEAGIIIICSSTIADSISDKLADSDICVLAKPCSRQKLSAALKLVTAPHTLLSGLKKESSGILSKIDEMRLINRAKCTLMHYLNFTEPQAHRYIEKQAMNNRRTRRDTAQKILETYKK